MLLQAGVEERECSSAGCRADTDSSLPQSGHGQKAMLPDAGRTRTHINTTFACLLTKKIIKSHKIQLFVYCVLEEKFINYYYDRVTMGTMEQPILRFSYSSINWPEGLPRTQPIRGSHCTTIIGY